jgi:hypothetical protein
LFLIVNGGRLTRRRVHRDEELPRSIEGCRQLVVEVEPMRWLGCHGGPGNPGPP